MWFLDKRVGAWIFVSLTAGAVGLFGLDCDRTRYGAGITLPQVTSISDLLASPEEFVGQKVRVAGEVVSVCQAAGCWMELQAGQGSQKIRVKVEDGVIVFPVSARGKLAEAEGVFARYEMGRKEYETHLQHEAAEKGEAPKEKVLGEGPFRVYQLEATGAEICKGNPKT